MVSRQLWNGLLTTFAVVLGGGIILALLLARGLADPPRDGLIVLEFESQGTANAPFTIETVAHAFEITCDDASTLRFEIRREGYFLVSAAEPDWQPFIHITRERNVMTLYVDTQLRPTFRINQEIAWVGALQSPSCSYQVINEL